MSVDEKRDKIKWAELDPLKLKFMESLTDNQERTWFWMYLSGLTVDEISREFSRPKARVLMSMKKTIEAYNQFVREEKQKAAAAAKASVAAEAFKQQTQPEQQTSAGQAPQAAAESGKSMPPTQRARQTSRPKTQQSSPRSRRPKEEKAAKPDAPARYRPKKQAQRLYAKLKRRVDSQFDKKFYIGDIRISQEEYEELLEYTRVQLRNVNSNSTALSDAPMVAVALVQIGIRCYNGNFWGNALKDELKVGNNPGYQKFLGDSFINTLKKHNKYIPDESERVQSILFHSFVTDYYSKGLFELLFQYYSKDLERDINRNDKAQMQALMDTLKRRSEMSEEESQTFTDQFSGRSRAYKLRLHTLQAIAANPTHSSMRLRRILRLMDRAFWNDAVPQRPISRLTILFKEWLQDSPTFSNEYKLYKSGVIRNRGKKHFSSPYLYADIRNTAFSVILPAQIVRQEQSEDLVWHVSVQDRQYDVPVEAYPVLTGFKTEGAKIPLPSELLFSEIRCRLSSGEVLARSFPAIPASNARIFDMDGDYAARIFKIPMCVYTRSGDTVKSPALLDRVPLGSLTRWDLEFVDGDILIFSDGKSLVAGERYADGLTKRGIVSGAVYGGEVGNKVLVYNRLPDILMTLPKDRTEGTVIDVNGSRYRLGSCRLDEFDSGDARGTRAFLVPLSQFGECVADALNRIIIDAPRSQYAKEYSFVYEPDLTVSFGGSPYVFEERGTVVFPEGLGVECLTSGAERLQGENGFSFEISQNLRSLTVRFNGKLTMELDAPVFMWSYDESEWFTEPMGDIWHTDFYSHRRLLFRSPSQKLEFEMDDDDADSDDQDEVHSAVCEKRADGIFVLDLTRFHSWITRDRVAHAISMRLGSSTYEFAKVYARSFVSSCDLYADYEAGELCCSGEFVGRGDYYVDITYLKTGVRVVEKGNISTGELRVPARLRNGRYQVDFFETEEEDDFFDEVTYLPVHSFTNRLINRNDLSGNQIRLISFRPKYHSMMYTRFAESYWIQDLDYIAPMTYEGRLRLTEDVTLRVRVVFEKARELRNFHLCFWDDEYEDYIEFLYDGEQRTLVMEEESGLRPSVRYRRYKVLFDGDYVFYGAVTE